MLKRIRLEMFQLQKPPPFAFQRCYNFGNVPFYLSIQDSWRQRWAFCFQWSRAPDEARIRMINQVIISILPMIIMVLRQEKIHQRPLHKSPGRLAIKEPIVRIRLCRSIPGLCNDGRGPHRASRVKDCGDEREKDTYILAREPTKSAWMVPSSN